MQDRHLPHDTYTRFGEVVKRLVRYDIQVGHAMNTNVTPKKNAKIDTTTSNHIYLVAAMYFKFR